MKGCAAEFLAVLAVGAFLSLGGCGDDGSPESPGEGPGRYRITAFLLEDLTSASVLVIRLDNRDPSPRNFQVTIDGNDMALDPNSTDEEATFERNLAPAFGVSHIYVAALGGKTATGTLTTPDQSCSLVITRPPADSLSFSSGEPIAVEWQYGGQEPGEFSLLAFNVPAPLLPYIYTVTVGPGGRSAIIPESATTQWSSSTQVRVTVRARVRTGVQGDLVDEGSTSTVHFAEADVFLQRQLP